MDIKILKLTDESIAAIQVLAEWFDNWYEWQKPYWSYKRIVRRLEMFIKNKEKESEIFVAKHGDIIVGTIGIARYDDTRKNAIYHPWLVNGYVSEEYRRKGIYRLLLRFSENYLKEMGYNKAYIRTDCNDLYEKLGWEYVKDIELDYGQIEKLYMKRL